MSRDAVTRLLAEGDDQSFWDDDSGQHIIVHPVEDGVALVSWSSLEEDETEGAFLVTWTPIDVSTVHRDFPCKHNS